MKIRTHTSSRSSRCRPDLWFGSHAEAIAALPEILNREECEPGTGLDEAAPIDDGRDSR
jgi:hypothetical protein